jgi:hypothetical protein
MPHMFQHAVGNACALQVHISNPTDSHP